MPTKLHLGCGTIKLEGFVNIDIKKTAAADRIMDVRKLDYPDNSVEIIYASHILEHFPPDKIEDILREWYRVLQKGGKAVIVVPNFDKFVSRYIFFRWIDRNKEKTNILLKELTAGEPDYNFEDYHKIIFNPEKFKNLVGAAGFREIKRINLKSKSFPILQVNPKNLHCFSMAFLIAK